MSKMTAFSFGKAAALNLPALLTVSFQWFMLSLFPGTSAEHDLQNRFSNS